MPTENSLAEAWPGSPVGRIAAPLREQVIEAFIDALARRRLLPGQRLIERELIEQFGVSRTTIREALRELSSQGLVTVLPQKGAIVSAPTKEDARDLYEVRMAIEPFIVRRFIDRASDEEIDGLERAVDEFESIVRETEDVGLLASAGGFYNVLIEGAGSTVFRQVIEGIQARLLLLRATSLSDPGRATQVVTELRLIVDAIRKRDAEAAAALCVDHVVAAAAIALASFDEPGTQSP